MIKSVLKFALIVVIAQVITYFLAGVIAQNVLGANQFYPPHPTAIRLRQEMNRSGWSFS